LKQKRLIMRKWINLIFGLFSLTIQFHFAAGAWAAETFLVKPYLQLGYETKSDATTATIVWFTGTAGSTTKDSVKVDQEQQKWKVEVKSGNSPDFKPAESVLERLVALPGMAAPVKKYTARFTRLNPGAPFTYRLATGGAEVFTATATAKKSADQPFKVTIFGDCGANTDGQRAIAQQVFKAKPDLVVIPGDIVYQHGLFHQYLTNFFPVYNQDAEEPSHKGVNKNLSVPMLRSIHTVGVLGNHDIALDGKGTNFEKHPDAMAYFIFWNQPLNGPGTGYGDRNTPPIVGEERKLELFKKSAGDAYPAMSNFSFNYGNSHWTVLDGNYYMDWTDQKTRKWLIDDLKGAQKATWRFVTFHQPAFSIDLPHGNEQRMRLISDILKKYKVDIVYAGHAHCYERSYPLTFLPKKGLKNFTVNANGTVTGALTTDTEYDGVTKTIPKGTIHIVTGAGGARLYLQGLPSDFILKYDSNDYSFTVMDVNDKTLTIKQINSKGKVIDQFVVTK